MVESKEFPFRQFGLFKPSWLGKRCASSAGFSATWGGCGGSNLTVLTHRPPCMAIIESSARAGQSYTKGKPSKTVKSGVSIWEDTGSGEGFGPFRLAPTFKRSALGHLYPPPKSCLAFGSTHV